MILIDRGVCNHHGSNLPDSVHCLWWHHRCVDSEGGKSFYERRSVHGRDHPGESGWFEFFDSMEFVTRYTWKTLSPNHRTFNILIKKLNFVFTESFQFSFVSGSLANVCYWWALQLENHQKTVTQYIKKVGGFGLLITFLWLVSTTQLRDRSLQI